jgi:hypothetical protein
MSTPLHDPSPAEWLRWLEACPGAHAQILEAHEGSIALAAHALARARLLSGGRGSPPPTRAELYAAAQEIHSRSGRTSFLPTAHALASECEHEGLDVIS